MSNKREQVRQPGLPANLYIFLPDFLSLLQTLTLVTVKILLQPFSSYFIVKDERKIHYEEVMTVLSKRLKLIIPVFALLLLLVAALPLFGSPPAAFAHITLEVNPGLVLSVDSESMITGVEFKEGAAQELFAGMDFIGMSLDQALTQIAGHLKEAGFLNPEDVVLLAVHPAEGIPLEEMTVVSERLEQLVENHPDLLQLAGRVETVILDPALYNAARKAGLWPSDYVVLVAHGAVAETITTLISIMDSAGISGQHYNIFEAYMDLRAAGLSEADALEVINQASAITSNATNIYEIASDFVDMQEVGIAFTDAIKMFQLGQNIDQNIFTEEFSTLTSDLIDMHEEGISIEVALEALRMAVAADHSLEEVSTIISAFIDLKEYGIADAAALELVRQAIAADPSLETFEILKQEGVTDEDLPDEDMPAEANVSGSAVNAQQASTIALGAVPDGTVVEVSSGFERGIATWELLILKPDGSGVEIYIDAATGKILKQENVPAADMQDEDMPAGTKPAENKYDDSLYVDYDNYEYEYDKVDKVDRDDKNNNRGGSKRSNEHDDE